jgi:CubicO group peptidase (beta-lactamase class C family)
VHRLSALIAVAAVIAACDAPTPVVAPPRLAVVDRVLLPYLSTGNFSGVVLLARGESPVHHAVYGSADCAGAVPATLDTRYHLASVSKPFTALAVMQLADDGLLHPSDPVARHVPDFPNGDRITIEHLLVHTSGIPNVNSFPEYDSLAAARRSTGELVAAFAGRPLEFEPGARYGYSNSNYNLLAFIVEQVSGRPYETFLDERVFRPAGMTATFHDTTDGRALERAAIGCSPAGLTELEPSTPFNWSVKTGNGSLASTATDLLRFARAITSGRLASEDATAAIFGRHLDNVGYGWFTGPLAGRETWYINGRSPGFSSFLLHMPAEDITLVVLSNVYNSLPTPVGRDVVRAYLGEEVETLVPTLDPPAAEAIRSYAGAYRFGDDFYVPGATIEVTVDGERLESTWGALYVTSDSTFIDRAYWTTFAFPRGLGRIADTLYIDSFAGSRVGD